MFGLGAKYRQVANPYTPKFGSIALSYQKVEWFYVISKMTAKDDILIDATICDRNKRLSDTGKKWWYLPPWYTREFL